MTALAPESRRWFDTPLPSRAQVTVAGVAGGVGTTTVTALLWWALTTYSSHAVGLSDHGGGALAARLPRATPSPAPGLVLHDAGAVALTGRLATSGPLVLVCSATEPGIQATASALHELTAGPEDAWQRAVVVPVATAGAGLPGTELRRHAQQHSIPSALVPLRRSRPLAAGGDVPAPGTSRATSDAHRTGAAIAAEVLRCATTMGSTPHAKRR